MMNKTMEYVLAYGGALLVLLAILNQNAVAAAVGGAMWGIGFMMDGAKDAS
jgi:hypothetical protein